MLFRKFKRVFSRTLYKDQMILTGKMDFAKDFIHDTRGDLYPIITASPDCQEMIRENMWQIISGETERMFCRFIPYLTCEMRAETGENAFAGFGYHFNGTAIRIMITAADILFHAEGEEEQRIPLPSGTDTVKQWLVTCRPGAFDVYLRKNGKAEFLGTFHSESAGNIQAYEVYSDGFVTALGGNGVTIHQVSAGVDNGVSTADIRAIRYEDGTPMVENGRIFFTVSLRMEEQQYQGIYAWVPGTADFTLTGVLFYDAGDGIRANDVAASILYHRTEKQWLLWVCSFSHGHIPGHSAFTGDPRYGVNVIDITLMPPMSADDPTTAFLGKAGDEDPDFVYDPVTGKWHMAICRIAPETTSYRYYFYESDSPFTGYHYIGRGEPGAETGGSFVTINGERCFICGNDFEKRSDYRIYRKDGMETPVFDFPDGGFRGWGTILPVKQGSRCHYYWLTFDRHKGSNYNWSYGNLYCFEGELQ